MKLPLKPPPFSALFQRIADDEGKRARFNEAMVKGTMQASVSGKYPHWDTLRHLVPPANLTHDEWWAGIKLSRMSQAKLIPLADEMGGHFRYVVTDAMQRYLHRVDRDASGRIQISEQVTNPQIRDMYLVKSLMEEAVTSSQLEGAATTREVATEMIRQGRRPRDRSERMVLNTYKAMQFIREQKGVELTPEFVFELQRIVTENTLSNADAAGRFRNESEDVCVFDETGALLHRPPAAHELPARLERLCAFANSRSEQEFVHPVIRSILVHFWLAYDHPFVDGNGRTARALFYWSMATQGYWLCEYLSISRILRKAPSKYARAFLYTESDDNDLTYFILYQLGVIDRAIDELHRYLDRKAQEIRATQELIRASQALRDKLNHRQIAVLNHALKHPGFVYTIESHRNSHAVSYETARGDLMDLVQNGLLDQFKRGKAYAFSAPTDLQFRIEAISERGSRRTSVGT